jgi:hypothetical protein
MKTLGHFFSFLFFLDFRASLPLFPNVLLISLRRGFAFTALVYRIFAFASTRLLHFCSGCFLNGVFRMETEDMNIWKNLGSCGSGH